MFKMYSPFSALRCFGQGEQNEAKERLRVLSILFMAYVVCGCSFAGITWEQLLRRCTSVSFKNVNGNKCATLCDTLCDTHMWFAREKWFSYIWGKCSSRLAYAAAQSAKQSVDQSIQPYFTYDGHGSSQIRYGSVQSADRYDWRPFSASMRHIIYALYG